MNSFVTRAVKVLVEREFRRMLSEPSRVIGILAQPLMFLVVFGSGFSKAFIWQNKEASYALFFFPGILTLVLLFSTIFSTLTLVEDKKCGLFKHILLSPAGLLGALLGKIIATSLIGFIQSLLFMFLIFFLNINLNFKYIIISILFLFVGSLVLAILGVLFACISPSPSAFHALMSIILIPMWVLSGAMSPLDNKILYILSLFNPVSYLVNSLRDIFTNNNYNLINLFTLFIFGLFFSLILKKKKEFL